MPMAEPILTNANTTSPPSSIKKLTHYIYCSLVIVMLSFKTLMFGNKTLTTLKTYFCIFKSLHCKIICKAFSDKSPVF